MDETFDLSVDHEIAAPPEDCFDAFVALYDTDRPAWVTESDLDLRVGGRWHVRFHPAPDPPFREERTVTDVHRGRELGYHARIQDDDGHERFATQVLVTFESTGEVTPGGAAPDRLRGRSDPRRVRRQLAGRAGGGRRPGHRRDVNRREPAHLARSRRSRLPSDVLTLEREMSGVRSWWRWRRSPGSA